MAHLTKCSICGSEYAYCPNCAGTHAWKFYTDTHEHYQIFMAIKQYGLTHDKEEARIALENIGITANSDLSAYKPKIAEKIKEIFEGSGFGFGKTGKKSTKRAETTKSDLLL